MLDANGWIVFGVGLLCLNCGCLLHMPVLGVVPPPIDSCDDTLNW